MKVSADVLEHIRTDAGQWAQSPTLPDQIIEQLFAEGLFKLFVPAAFGGKEASLSQAAELYTTLATADGSVAWLVQIGAGGGFFVPSFDQEIAREIYSPPDAVIAGSGYPTGQARKVAGGYRVTGQWKYASGAQYARVFTANAVIEGSKTVRAFAFWRKQVSLIEDWQSFGLRATSSWSFHVADVFVPDELSFVVGEKVWDPGVAVYNVPFLLFAIASFGAVAIGLARAFFDEAFGILSSPPAEHLDYIHSLRDSAQEADTTFFHILRRIDAMGTNTPADRIAQYRTVLLVLLKRIFDTVWRMLPWCGMQLLPESARLNRIVRDLLTVRQHELLRPPVEVPGVEPGSEVPVV